MFRCEGWCNSSRQGASFQRRFDYQHCQPDLSPLLPETWCLETARGRLSPGSGCDCSVEVGADYEQTAGCNWKRSYQKHESDRQKLRHGHSLTYRIWHASDFVDMMWVCPRFMSRLVLARNSLLVSETFTFTLWTVRSTSFHFHSLSPCPGGSWFNLRCRFSEIFMGSTLTSWTFWVSWHRNC